MSADSPARNPLDTAYAALDDLAQVECTCAHHPYAACGYCGAVNRVREALAAVEALVKAAGWRLYVSREVPVKDGIDSRMADERLAAALRPFGEPQP